MSKKRSVVNKTVNLLQQINEWNKKPSLDYDLSSAIQTFRSEFLRELKTGTHSNFATAALFIQGCGNVYEKKVQLLDKRVNELNRRLIDVLSTGQTADSKKKENAATPSTKQSEPEHAEKAKDKKCQLKSENEPKKEKRKRKSEQKRTLIDDEEKEENEKKRKLIELELQKPTVHDVLREKLKQFSAFNNDLTSMEKYMSELEPGNPLREIFNCVGNESKSTDKLFTFSDISLSGTCWNLFYQLELQLRKCNEQIKMINNNNRAYKKNFELTVNECSENKRIKLDCCVNLIRLPENMMDRFIKKPVLRLQEIRVNLFRIPDKYLRKTKPFKLPPDYLQFEKALARRKRNEKRNRMKRKSDEIEATELMKKSKIFNAVAFEEFMNYYQEKGVAPPRSEQSEVPQQTEPEPESEPEPQVQETAITTIPSPIRKSTSIDDCSVISYDFPITPDSGKFSLSYQTDSEFEHHDETRPDSGLGMSSQSDTDTTMQSEHEEDPTVQRLKNLFPTVFADKERTAVLRQDITNVVESTSALRENCTKWRDFIENETSANDSEFFKIEEYSEYILNVTKTDVSEEITTRTKQMTFQSIVENKPVEDVGRYFIAMLHLANSNDIEIIDKYPGTVNPDRIHLKRISSDFINDQDLDEEHFQQHMDDDYVFHSTPKSF